MLTAEEIVKQHQTYLITYRGTSREMIEIKESSIELPIILDGSIAVEDSIEYLISEGLKIDNLLVREVGDRVGFDADIKVTI